MIACARIPMFIMSLGDDARIIWKEDSNIMTDQSVKQYKQLGLTIAYYRKLKGITQQSLAEAVNLSRTHISNLEAPNMPTSISLEKLFDIAEVLNVPVKNFFDFRD